MKRLYDVALKRALGVAQNYDQTGQSCNAADALGNHEIIKIGFPRSSGAFLDVPPMVGIVQILPLLRRESH